MKRTLTSSFVSLACLSLLAGCASTPDLVSSLNPFKIDVRQGNYVSQEMVVQLKPGMTREQVRFVLGSPLVADMFHADRWDYVYRFQPGSGPAQQRRLIVFFEENRLVRVGGDVVGSEPGTAEPAKPSVRTLDIAGPEGVKPVDAPTEKAEAAPPIVPAAK